MATFAVDKLYNIGIVGATGAVGIEVVRCLEKRSFPVGTVHLYASARSAGKSIASSFGELIVEEFIAEKVRSDCEFVFLAVSGDFALKYAKDLCSGDGPIVIDNSSAYRYDAEIPLVIPEINPQMLAGAKLIANPNCTTAVAAVALWPLHCEFKLKKLIMSTYQAASGAGAEGMEELVTGTASSLKGEEVKNSVFAHPLPFNVIPQIDKFLENGYTKEEMKVAWETLKIFGLTSEELKVSCTAVRIPVMRAHSEAITIETERPITPDAARSLLSNARGVRLVDDPANGSYPMPLNAANCDDVEVGRIRSSLIFEPCGLDLFVSGDQLLRGAALNAVLIAEKIIEMKS